MHPFLRFSSLFIGTAVEWDGGTMLGTSICSHHFKLTGQASMGISGKTPLWDSTELSRVLI